MNTEHWKRCPTENKQHQRRCLSCGDRCDQLIVARKLRLCVFCCASIADAGLRAFHDWEGSYFWHVANDMGERFYEQNRDIPRKED